MSIVMMANIKKNKVYPLDTSSSSVIKDDSEMQRKSLSRSRPPTKRFFRQGTNPKIHTSSSGLGEHAAKTSVHSEDRLAGESNDPTMSLLDYILTLVRRVEDEIDFDHMQTLIDNGADINATSIHTGMSVLHSAAINWDSSVALFLIERGADVHQTDSLGRTCLHLAACSDHSEMIECILKCGGDIEGRTYNEKQTPMHYAVRSNSLNALRALVEHNGNYEAKDYNGRSPLHLAAELDRTYAAKYLLSLNTPAECRVMDNNKTPLLVTMIRTMPGVARAALNQLQFLVPSERKQYFLLSYLEPSPKDKQARRRKTPFEVAVELERFEILDHSVIKEIIVQKWKSFARGHFLLYFFTYLMFLLSWTALIAYPSVKEKHIYNFPQDIWRLLLELVALVLYFKQIGEEINEYTHSKTSHSISKVRIIKTLEDDLSHTDSCFPEERKYLENELRRIKNSSPNYFKDPENYLDLITFAVLFLIIILHLLDVFAHGNELAMWVARVSCIGVILIWVRLLKFLSAFKKMGPLIAIVKHLIGDIAKYFILYGIFFVPYSVCFFTLFGGSQSADLEGAEDLTTYQRVVVMCFRMSLIDDYPFDTLRAIDEYMTALLVVTFLVFTAMIGLNLFIALLSNTFKQIYDNAQANAEMQKAAIILSLESKALDYWYRRYLNHIHTNCNPTFNYYDDDDLPTSDVAMTTIGGGPACTKTTQLAHELTSNLDTHHVRVSEDVAHLSKQIKYFSDSLIAVQDYQEQGMQFIFQQLAEMRTLLDKRQLGNSVTQSAGQTITGANEDLAHDHRPISASRAQSASSSQVSLISDATLCEDTVEDQMSTISIQHHTVRAGRTSIEHTRAEPELHTNNFLSSSPSDYLPNSSKTPQQGDSHSLVPYNRDSLQQAHHPSDDKTNTLLGEEGQKQWTGLVADKQETRSGTQHKYFHGDKSSPSQACGRLPPLLPQVQKYSTTQLLQEIFPSRQTPSELSLHPTAAGLDTHQPSILIGSHTHLSPSPLREPPPNYHVTENNPFPSAASSRASILDELASQSSYVTVNHRRFRARDESDVKKEQWLSKIHKINTED